MPFAEFLNRCSTFRVAYFLVAFLQRVRSQSLPRKAATKEVHEHMPDGFQIVPAALLTTQVSVDTHVSAIIHTVIKKKLYFKTIFQRVPGCSRQRLVFSVWYVTICFRVDVLLREPEVWNINTRT